MLTSQVKYYGSIQRKLTDLSSERAYLGSEDFQRHLEEEIEHLRGTEPFTLVSVDVFDTLLLRNEKSELTRFWEVAQKLEQHCDSLNVKLTAKEIFLARLLATRASYRLSHAVDSCREGSIDEIYCQLSRILGLPSSFAIDFVKLEIDYELENLKPNVKLWDTLMRMKRDSIKIVALSDMYLHREHIEILIDKLLPQAVSDLAEIRSSADTKVSKHSGKAFSKLVDDYRMNASRCLHIGDSYHSDFVQAIRNGFRSLHLPIPEGRLQSIQTDQDITVDNLKRLGIRPSIIMV